MCGIIGYTGTVNAVPKLLEGLSALEYRGYDSAGIAVMDGNGTISVVKSKGRLSNLDEKIKSAKNEIFGFCGIGHTRWATHGAPNDANSHPHGTEKVQIVHNGIIENYAAIKKFLLSKNYSFDSETDTESAAKLIDYFYRQTGDPILALRKAAAEFAGSYAVCAVFAEFPGKIYAVRRESPLVAAKTSDGVYFASDIPALLKYTNEYYRVAENEIAVGDTDKVCFVSENGSFNVKSPETADFDAEKVQKDGFAHFMIKEIYDEPGALTKTLRLLIKGGMPDLGVAELSDKKLASFEKIHIVACGTAYHAGIIGKFAVEKLARVSVNAEVASEFRYKNPILGKNDLVILISQSGETADTLAALRLAKKEGAYTLAVVNVVGSTAASEADGVIYTRAGTEIAVASTKAYTVQTAVMYLFALRLAYAAGKLAPQAVREYTAELLEKIPFSVAKTLECENKCRAIADRYKNSKSVFFIGRGSDYAVSMEAALKLKEISYINCEAYPAGELKHGTISLVTDGTPVFAIALNSQLFEKTVSNIKEVKARGASVILVTGEKFDVPENTADEILRIPDTDELFSPITAATALQLTAYHISRLLGLDVDKPRNLAKSVTVE